MGGAVPPKTGVVPAHAVTPRPAPSWSAGFRECSLNSNAFSSSRVRERPPRIGAETSLREHLPARYAAPRCPDRVFVRNVSKKVIVVLQKAGRKRRRGSVARLAGFRRQDFERQRRRRRPSSARRALRVRSRKTRFRSSRNRISLRPIKASKLLRFVEAARLKILEQTRGSSRSPRPLRSRREPPQKALEKRCARARNERSAGRDIDQLKIAAANSNSEPVLAQVGFEPREARPCLRPRSRRRRQEARRSSCACARERTSGTCRQSSGRSWHRPGRRDRRLAGKLRCDRVPSVAGEVVQLLLFGREVVTCRDAPARNRGPSILFLIVDGSRGRAVAVISLSERLVEGPRTEMVELRILAPGGGLSMPIARAAFSIKLASRSAVSCRRERGDTGGAESSRRAAPPGTETRLRVRCIRSAAERCDAFSLASWESALIARRITAVISRSSSTRLSLDAESSGGVHFESGLGFGLQRASRDSVRWPAPDRRARASPLRVSYSMRRSGSGILPCNDFQAVLPGDFGLSPGVFQRRQALALASGE